MRIGCHQPYLFPYRGYFDLIASVDKFIIYDDAQWMKSSYINRNYFPERFTFKVKRHSSFAPINKCYFSCLESDKRDFKRYFPKLKVDRYFNALHPELDIATNCARTLRMVCDTLKIYTPFYFSSDIPHRKFDKGLIDMVKHLGGDTYVNAPGGRQLYTQEMFGKIKLEFVDTKTGPSILCQL